MSNACYAVHWVPTPLSLNANLVDVDPFRGDIEVDSLLYPHYIMPNIYILPY